MFRCTRGVRPQRFAKQREISREIFSGIVGPQERCIEILGVKEQVIRSEPISHDSGRFEFRDDCSPRERRIECFHDSTSYRSAEALPIASEETTDFERKFSESGSP